MKTYLIIFFTLFASVGIAQNVIDTQAVNSAEVDSLTESNPLKKKIVPASNSKTDSLLNLLENAKTDTNKSNLLIKISYAYYTYDLNKSLEHAIKCLILSKQLKFNKGIVRSMSTIGLVYYHLGDYDKALEYHFSVMKLNEESGYKRGVAGNLSNISNVYREQGNDEKALHYLFKALKINQEIGYKPYEAINLNNIGLIFKNQENYEKALQFYFEALKVNEELNQKKHIAFNFNNIASVYDSKGNIEKAMKFHQKSYEINQELDDKNGIAMNLNNMGVLYEDQKEYDKALELHKQCLSIQEDLGNKSGVGSSLNNIGRIYSAQGNYSEALSFLSRSLIIVKQIGGIPGIQGTYKSLYQTHFNQNEFEKAFEYLQLYSALDDSLFKEEKSKQIAEMQAKYETEKKEKENELLLNKTKIQKLQLSRRNYVIYGLAGIAMFILVIGLLIINQNKLRAKNRAAELEQNAMKLEQQLLRSQMNPHFIFNSLNAIQSFLYDHDPEEAGIYLSKFAILVRLILENSRREFIPLEKEIKFLEHYLELQQLRFENAFDFDINTSSEIDVKATAIPPMLAQPFIENSLEHGFQRLKNKGMITVNFDLKDGELIFTIEDNGIGRTAAGTLGNTKNVDHDSLATKITAERLSILNKRHDQRINLIITDLDGSGSASGGTKVTFHIPFTYIGFDNQET